MRQDRAYRVVALLAAVPAIAAGALFASILLGGPTMPAQSLGIGLVVAAIALVAVALVLRTRAGATSSGRPPE